MGTSRKNFYDSLINLWRINYMLFLIAAALFIIVWYALGGLRSPFGKAVLVFSIIGILGFGVIVIYALSLDKPISNNPPTQALQDLTPCPNQPGYYRGVDGQGCNSKPDFLTNYNKYHPQPY